MIMRRFGVIMAGGKGTRLWPISNRQRPKQFMEIDGETLLRRTVNRAAKLPLDKVYVVTTREQRDQAIRESPPAEVICEPEGKGTAGAVLFVARDIDLRWGDGIMVVFPCDHDLEDSREFSEAIETACNLAEKGYIAVLGVPAKYPETGYGYMRVADRPAEGWPVVEFVQKPDADRAEELVKQGSLWCTAIWAAKISVILEEYQRAMPLMEGDSVEGAIISKAENVVAVLAPIRWTDIGNYERLADIMPKDHCGNAVKGNHVGIDTLNSVIYADGGTVVTVGVRDLVVAKWGDLVMVCPKDRAETLQQALVGVIERCDRRS